MILLDLKLKRILCFNSFHANFTYPKKLVNQLLDDEYLKDYPNFRYNKINVIMGANSSGKTALGLIILNVFNFFHSFNDLHLKGLILNKEDDACLEMDFLDDNYTFHRFKAEFKGGSFVYYFGSLVLKPTDTYESASKSIKVKYYDSVKRLGLENSNMPIKYIFNFTEHKILNFDPIISYFDEYIDVLNTIMLSFDSSITSIVKSREINECLIVKFNNNSFPIKNKILMNDLYFLSTGTKYAFLIAELIIGLRHSIFGFYYIDELCSNIEGHLEKELLASLVNLTKQNEQLFFTTHNAEILSMSLPNHAYCFLKKDKDKNYLIKASDVEKRNNVDIKNLYLNNYFDVFPDVNVLLDL